MSGIMPWDSVIDLIKTGIDKIWPDKTETDKAKAALAQAQLQGALKDMEGQWDNAKAQIEVNKQEAASNSIFNCGLASIHRLDLRIGFCVRICIAASCRDDFKCNRSSDRSIKTREVGFRSNKSGSFWHAWFGRNAHIRES
ncbi:MAG TPA: 3TM-type holin [Burkholderiales bacterium]|nr:3TM-type holin [Burkholderiales bacterium]